VKILHLVILMLVASITDLTADDTLPEKLSWAKTAAQIDRLFESAWQREQVVPADIASDQEFIRRIYLDLAGRVPAVSEVRGFLASREDNRRNDVVEELLQNPAYVRHMTIVWRNALIPQAMTQQEFRPLIPGFDAWLWERLADNIRYDQIVREIITSNVLSHEATPQAGANTTSPDAFFVVRGLMPESLATGTARAFLGVRLDCAQCHDHPFDKWKQEQFWNLAAFYSGFARDNDNPAMMPTREQPNQRSIAIPGTETTVPAVFLTGESPGNETAVPRVQLADWIVAKENPWFGSMAANRMWAQFFGMGIVHPTDDFSDDNPPAHPEVLQLLADQFSAHDFDLTFLIRTIVGTNVYQQSSVQSHASQAVDTMFARAAVRGLTPEQLFDSLAEAVGFYQPYRRDNPFVVDTDSPRGRFIELFRNDAESSLDHRSTILQALAMMNGDFVGNATDLKDSRTLRAVTEFPLMSVDDRLDTLFLAALSRSPTEGENRMFAEHFARAKADNNEATAFADIFWALLNSSEFLLNH
jgi:hypothetical protein